MNEYQFRYLCTVLGVYFFILCALIAAWSLTILSAIDKLAARKSNDWTTPTTDAVRKENA